jgi:aspartyl-tRNA(Asn)/glutamyl-tRNA(Gln) amidotransferase subunit B
MPVNNATEYNTVIGLEVHAQLLTRSKMFCGCRNDFGAPPNSLTCPVCLGLPGALPVTNEKAVEYAIGMVLAVGGTVQLFSEFARKNYFYPDLPKGYQITQYENPIGLGGKVAILTNGLARDIELARIHLEEDAGKLIHPEKEPEISRVDLNRCGVPLLEIVTEPTIGSPQEARFFLSKLKQILQYLKICSGDMEKGALRCDANISVQPKSAENLGSRTELKNLNSFRAVEKALTFEINRQRAILENGGEVVQETRLWNEGDQCSEAMRSKEESEDYRYFREPDLPPLIIGESWIQKIMAELPELPDAKKIRLKKEYRISEYDASVLAESATLADYFEDVAKKIDDPKLAANWLMVEVLREIKERRIDLDQFFIRPGMLAELLLGLKSNIISGRMARDIFMEMAETGKRAGDIIDEKGIKQITDKKGLLAVIQKVLRQEHEKVDKYKAGKVRLFDYFVGQVMKATDGQANPELVNEILREKLDG